MDPVLEVRHLNSYYSDGNSIFGQKSRRHQVLKDVSFDLYEGEILGLTGLVGAGRTEVVEAICGITSLTKGDIYLEGKKVDIQRSKGLGENTKEMMWMTTMNPETRRLIKVMPEHAERTAMYFDMLLGDALQERKDFIAENGAKYLELADIS